jgi:NAD(P)-dependent dehydrogenase (short-subunit alcohol dehydrogenase family)
MLMQTEHVSPGSRIRFGARTLKLNGQTVLVTGAARGVGEAIAYGAPREGARVVAADQDSAGLNVLMARVRAQNRLIEAVVADISTVQRNAQAVSLAASRFGPLNTFIANAAIIRFGDTLATSEEDWDAIHQSMTTFHAICDNQKCPG